MQRNTIVLLALSGLVLCFTTRMKPQATVAQLPISMPSTEAADPTHLLWNDYAGGEDAAQYSALAQIDRSNVNQLQVAWSYPTADGNKYLFNPIVVDRTMYVLAKNNS